MSIDQIPLNQILFGILFCLALATIAMLMALGRKPAGEKTAPALPSAQAAEDAGIAARRAAARERLAGFKSAMRVPLDEAAAMSTALRRATGTASRLPLTLEAWPADREQIFVADGALPNAVNESLLALPALIMQREELAAALRAAREKGAAFSLSPLQSYLRCMAEITWHLDAALQGLEISAAGPSAYQDNIASAG